MNIIKVSHLNYHTASLMSMTKAKLKGDLHTNEYYSIHATVVAYSIKCTSLYYWAYMYNVIIYMYMY